MCETTLRKCNRWVWMTLSCRNKSDSSIAKENKSVLEISKQQWGSQDHGLKGAFSVLVVESICCHTERQFMMSESYILRYMLQDIWKLCMVIFMDFKRKNPVKLHWYFWQTFSFVKWLSLLQNEHSWCSSLYVMCVCVPLETQGLIKTQDLKCIFRLIPERDSITFLFL